MMDEVKIVNRIKELAFHSTCWLGVWCVPFSVILSPKTRKPSVLDSLSTACYNATITMGGLPKGFVPRECLPSLFPLDNLLFKQPHQHIVFGKFAQQGRVLLVRSNDFLELAFVV